MRFNSVLQTPITNSSGERFDQGNRSSTTALAVEDIMALAIGSSLLIFVAVAALALAVGQPASDAVRIAVIIDALFVIAMVLLSTLTYLGVVGGIIDHWLLARLELRRITADYLTNRARIEADKQVRLASIGTYGALREETDRKVLASCGSQQEQIPVGDPLRDFAVTLLIEAYRERDQDGWVPKGIISRQRVMDAGFTQAQYEELKRLLEGSGIMRYERQQWRLNARQYHDVQEAAHALAASWDAQQ